MKSYDNFGRLASEQTVTQAKDGRVIYVNTQYNTGTGGVVSQTVAERDSAGRVKTTTALNGKLRP